MRIIIICAIGKNNEIGKNNNLIWHLPKDLNFFKEHTLNKTVVMGYNTYKSLPKKLPNRKMIVLYDKEIEGVKTYSNEYIMFQDLNEEEIYIIGGSSLYNKFISIADEMYLTEIDATDLDADTYFPKFDKRKWNCISLGKESDNNIEYEFKHYTRKKTVNHNKKVIIINGTGGSGKDTFVKYVSKYIKTKNYSSIDKVKEIATLIGWTGGKTEKDRKFLSDLKKLTTEYNDMAFNDIKNEVEKFYNSDNELMFIHIREPEEIKKAADSFAAKTLLVKREGLSNIESNYSDREVDNYNYDFIINNTTLEDLDKEAKAFVKKLHK